MSEAVTNIEIEDVLSSIRRLVADTDRPDEPYLATDKAKDATDARFVLTPALRVKDAALPETQTESNDGQSARTDTLLLGPEDAVTMRASLEATIAELEAAVTSQPDEWELDGSEVKGEVTWESAGFVHHASKDAAEPAIAADEPVAAELVAAEPVAAEPVVEDVVELAEHFTPEEPVHAPFRRSDTVVIEAQAEDEDQGDDLSDIPEPDMDPDAELETYLSGNPSIDDKLLREMVQQVVREELQGHLGERITRNVRKLVRREIHRVLTSQDFD